MISLFMYITIKTVKTHSKMLVYVLLEQWFPTGGPQETKHDPHNTSNAAGDKYLLIDERADRVIKSTYSLLCIRGPVLTKKITKLSGSLS